MPGSAGMATPGVPLAQSLKSIPRFGRAFLMIGAHAVPADERLLGCSQRF